MRGSRRRLVGQRRPTALLMTISSPSSVYQTTAWRGRAVGVGRGDGGVALVVEEGSDVVGKADGSCPRWYARGAPHGDPAWRGSGLVLTCWSAAAAARVGRRLPEQVALAEFDAERRQRGEVGPALDAFGEEVGADPPAERDERLDQRLLGVVVGDAVDDLAVDLDDRRPERGDEREAGVAGAGVVDREPEAELAQGLDLALERADVGDRLLLGALDGDLARVEAGGADLGGRAPSPRRRGRAG